MKARNILAVVLMGISGGACAADFAALHNFKASDIGASAPEPEIKPFYVGTGSRLGSARPIEWVTLNGGKFKMGTDGAGTGIEDAKPVHEVAIKTFDMSKTAVTVEQYAQCVGKGACTAPRTGDYCNWGVAGRQLHPVNCVDREQADQFARFKSARLPSEAEWEYAAKSGGRDQKYPWGNDEPSCAQAVMYGDGGYGCGNDGTMPVCSKPAGNTAQGLCDMAGNVWQWVQDKYQYSYAGAPADGGAVEAAGLNGVMRGGSFRNRDARLMRADIRNNDVLGARLITVGFRLARSR